MERNIRKLYSKRITTDIFFVLFLSFFLSFFLKRFDSLLYHFSKTYNETKTLQEIKEIMWENFHKLIPKYTLKKMEKISDLPGFYIDEISFPYFKNFVDHDWGLGVLTKDSWKKPFPFYFFSTKKK